MQTSSTRRFVLALIALCALGWLGWSIQQRLQDSSSTEPEAREKPPVPVEVADILQGPIEARRVFTGTLEARAEFEVAPKVSGRLQALSLDLADEVTRNQVVAVLDDAEYVQDVARAAADLAVAKASAAEAGSLLKIAERELDRIEKLQQRGVSSESQRDTAKAEQLAKQALVAMGRARVASAEADLEAARIRLGYTQVNAGWRGGSERRVVAERYVDEGEMVEANTPLLRIVELDPITAVFFVTERDYAQLQSGQSAVVATDAYPGEHFRAQIERIAPVFREVTRQARVELRVENPQLRLKPGMFARATIVLDRDAQATIVPAQALTKRDEETGVFVVGPEARTAVWRSVRTGIRDGERIQVRGDGIEGRVVVLGQQSLEDGSPIRITSDAAAAP
ncbi:efflux RND transporter periplasmic adaptor subunit [Thiorhodococcus mannitoliphagus]|uniref:Efflux RND transporter periplasmic adaptor subunit n=1 Tax=Thiorhodococcus mannitoliphagus TaxID=329406 RepID=A0A6P1DTF5_9GAMM|nr:efflux RND transporter periplasmic adaptor subunit [Thiorhodococcus mannitoliphagus]NEX18995.1 efflux RND transporter periplasmic adaptor subunit [Thiorhodococcus mannitoliphagus]